MENQTYWYEYNAFEWMSEHGVLPPEACFDPLPFIEEVASNGPGWTKEKKLFETNPERLE